MVLRMTHLDGIVDILSFIIFLASLWKIHFVSTIKYGLDILRVIFLVLEFTVHPTNFPGNFIGPISHVRYSSLIYLIVFTTEGIYPTATSLSIQKEMIKVPIFQSIQKTWVQIILLESRLEGHCLNSFLEKIKSSKM